MLIYGVANPAGEHGNYNGLYLRDVEIDDMIKKGSLKGKPVKIEHRGVDIGKIISAFKDDKKQLVCVIEVSDHEIEGAIAQEWIKDNTIKDLSLGYTVDIDKKEDRLKAVGKNVMEVSLVKKGARENCHIYTNEIYKNRDDGKDRVVAETVVETVEKPVAETVAEPVTDTITKEPELKRPRLEDWKYLLNTE